MVAIVGGDTLLARELREVLSETPATPRIQLISAAPDGAAVLNPEEEEAVVMVPLAAETLEGSRVAFLAGTPASAGAP
jgi:hypothetical protein